MEFITVFVIAVGLAMDAFAVSIASGTAYTKLNVKHAFRIAAFFGAFQAVMPVVGHLAGTTVKPYIARYDHWLAFALLAGIGLKMIYESFRINSSGQIPDPRNIGILLVLSVATSIDALAVGLTLSLLDVSLLGAVIEIGLITFCFSYAGVYVGKSFGHLFESKIEVAGGVILIGIGIKILLQHLMS